MDASVGKKYIPPHRREQVPNLSRHAAERQQQRDIFNASIHSATSSGVEQRNRVSTTYRSETTQVVAAPDGFVITVLENKRNTGSDLLRVSVAKKEELLIKARRGNDYAMCELAELYLSGDLGNREVREAQDCLMRAAQEKENSHAMCLLSALFESGDLGKKDPVMAFAWLEKAAEKRNLESQNGFFDAVIFCNPHQVHYLALLPSFLKAKEKIVLLGTKKVSDSSVPDSAYSFYFSQYANQSLRMRNEDFPVQPADAQSKVSSGRAGPRLLK